MVYSFIYHELHVGNRVSGNCGGSGGRGAGTIGRGSHGARAAGAGHRVQLQNGGGNRAAHHSSAAVVHGDCDVLEAAPGSSDDRRDTHGDVFFRGVGRRVCHQRGKELHAGVHFGGVFHADWGVLSVELVEREVRGKRRRGHARAHTCARSSRRLQTVERLVKK